MLFPVFRQADAGWLEARPLSEEHSRVAAMSLDMKHGNNLNHCPHPSISFKVSGRKVVSCYSAVSLPLTASVGAPSLSSRRRGDVSPIPDAKRPLSRLPSSRLALIYCPDTFLPSLPLFPQLRHLWQSSSRRSRLRRDNSRRTNRQATSYLSVITCSLKHHTHFCSPLNLQSK